MFGRLKKHTAAQAAAGKLLEGVRAGARNPALFGEGRIPDTIDGRFENMVLHAVLVMERLRGGGPAAAEASQALFDALFKDLDAAVREMGAFDLSVAKRIRRMGEAFYGRLLAYHEALEQGDDALGAALARNLFATQPPSDAFLAAMTGYVRASHNGLAGQSLDALLAGESPRWSGAPA